MIFAESLSWSVGSSVVIVVSCQLLVAVLALLVRFKADLARHAEICVMSLGVGTMVADAMLHILPEAIEDHQHRSGHDHFSNLLLGSSAIAGMVFVIVVEFLVHSLGHGGHSHEAPKEAVEDARDVDFTRDNEEDCEGKVRATFTTSCASKEGVDINSHMALSVYASKDDAKEHKRLLPKEHHHHGEAHDHDHGDDFHERHQGHSHSHGGHGHGFTHLLNEKEPTKDLQRQQRVTSACYANIIAEILHNIIDGLALGVAFNSDISTGIATGICVLVHEIPMQFTDYILIVKAGYSIFWAFVINVFVALFITVGAFLPAYGISNFTLQTHLLMATGGNFLALSLVQLLPEIRASILEGKSQKTLSFVAVICLLLGCVIVGCVGIGEDFVFKGHENHHHR